MPFWMSAIAEGSVETALRSSLAALSTASSIVVTAAAPIPRRARSRRLAHLAAGHRQRPVRDPGDGLVGEADPFAGGVDVPRPPRPAPTRRTRPWGQVSFASDAPTGRSPSQLLGQRGETLGGVDHQIAHLVRRLGLGVEFLVGPRRRPPPPGSADRGARAADQGGCRRASDARRRPASRLCGRCPPRRRTARSAPHRTPRKREHQFVGAQVQAALLTLTTMVFDSSSSASMGTSASAEGSVGSRFCAAATIG